MSKVENKTSLPRLRFPEFQSQPEWDVPTLGKISDRIEEKVGSKQLTTVSITAGKGFVSQAEKFSRDISGQQYKNYIKLQEGDFAYNKGNSKRFPQGCIYKLKEFKQVAAPNAFICFRFKKEFVSDFYLGYFEGNFHGKQLQKFITSGARMDGLLNISPDDFFSIVFPTPKDKKEQQKIADCLSSIDDLITAHTNKLDALKAHKKGLMQQLFPTEGETVPKLRFKEFEGSGEWKETTLGQCLQQHPDYGLNAPAVPYSINLPTYLRITDISEEGYFLRNQIVSVDREVTEDNYLKEGDIVLARTGASVGKSYKYRKVDGRLVFAGFLIRVKTDKNKIDSELLFQFFSTDKYWHWVKFISARSGQPGINGNEYASMPLFLPPKIKEQQKIANCLSSLDELIKEQGQKIETLKAHKKGLLQGLFPTVYDIKE